MTINYLGELSIGAAVPGAAVAVAAGIAGINGALPSLSAMLAQLQAFIPQPGSMQLSLTLAMGMVEGIQAAIDLGIPYPDLSAQIAAVMALIQQLLDQLSLVQTQLTSVIDIGNMLTTAGFHALVYSGSASDFGSELSAALPTITGASYCNGLVLCTTASASWSVASTFFKVS